MNEIKFYHPENGREIVGTLVEVFCGNPECSEYSIPDTVWDLGTGVFCGLCETQILPENPKGMTYVEKG